MNQQQIQHLLSVIDAGLIGSVGEPQAGNMCVESATAFALGYEFNDSPPCVAKLFQRYAIGLNDAPWSSPASRAAGMRRFAVAHVGSNGVDEVAAIRHIALHTVKRILPIALRAIGLEDNALQCETATDLDAAAYAYAAAADADADADAYAAAYAYAAAADAYAAAADAYAACAAYAAHAVPTRADEILTLAAEIGVEALQLVNAPGCAFLHLCDEVAA